MSIPAHRPRELRRRVVLPARLNTGAHWSDTCILNISSRGLLIHSARPAEAGSRVELRRGDHVIRARVVWRDGGRIGLHAEERIPVEDILTLGQSAGLQLTAAARHGVERRRRPRSAEESRQKGRVMEFAGILLIAVSLALSVTAMVQEVLARPLASAASALSLQR
ncbi:MAG TPA: PilZ domain-containing protein [Sphingomicrobium sp.]|nr:PilZ domain-containing protein [Sphingomicrobium sp.]